MTDIFISKLADLLCINSTEAQKIIRRFCRNRELEVIKMLNDYPELQLEYLEKLIENNGRESVFSTKDIQLLYVKLLCKFKKSKVH